MPGASEPDRAGRREGRPPPCPAAKAPLISIALVALVLGAAPERAGAEPLAAEPQAVVLLHGLGRSPFAMRHLERSLSAEGYAVHNLGYASTREAVPELLDTLHAQLDACCTEAERLHFVTHSMGGILTRAYLAEQKPSNLGRVVMLAPPNHGSELADVLSRTWLLRRLFGPNVLRLGTDPESLPNQLPTPDFELGVIAGTKVRHPLGAVLVPGQSDGTVSIESARIDGMADFATVHATHTFIMRSRAAARLVSGFLRTGAFPRIVD